MSWVETRLNTNNPLRAGYDSLRTRIDDLQILKVDDYQIPVIKEIGKPFNPYKSSLTNAPNYMRYLNGTALAKLGDCQALLYLNEVRSGDLKTQYFNTNYSPSFIWQETLATLGHDSLHVYSDGQFEILQVYLTYLRYPKKIYKSGYTRLDGTQSQDQDCELPEYAKQDLIDIAVKFASHATENFPVSQAAEDRLIKHDE
jgi:hypothetical protein